MRKVNFWFGVVSVAALSLGSTVFAQDEEVAQGLNGNGGEIEVEEVVESVDTAPTQEEALEATPEAVVPEKKSTSILKMYEDNLESPVVNTLAGVTGRTRRFVTSLFSDFLNNKELAEIKEKIWNGNKKYRILVPAMIATNMAEYWWWSRGKTLERKYTLDYLKFNIPFKEWRSKLFSTGIGMWILYLLSHENDGKPVEPVEAEQEVQAEPVAAKQPEAAPVQAPVAPTPTPEAA